MSSAWTGITCRVMWSVTVCRVPTRVECDHEAEVCCRHARLRVGGTKRLLSMGHASVFALLLVALAGGCGSGPAAVWGRPRPRPRIPAAHGRLRSTATFPLSRWSRAARSSSRPSTARVWPRVDRRSSEAEWEPGHLERHAARARPDDRDRERSACLGRDSALRLPSRRGVNLHVSGLGTVYG